jgi:hypothetical protein
MENKKSHHHEDWLLIESVQVNFKWFLMTSFIKFFVGSLPLSLLSSLVSLVSLQFM